jgi:hypothetical protein
VAEKLLGLERVVRPAAELQVIHRGLSSRRVRLHVMELEEAAFFTAPLRADEGAAAAIALADHAFHRGRDVPRM